MPPKATAKINGKVIAESDEYETVEGNIYFPPSAITRSFLTPSDTNTICGWKGTASYYNVEVDGVYIKDAAWYYPDPKDKFKPFRNYVAFCMYAPLMLHLKRVPFRLR
ncbi:uncharacterized protein H6S33_004462 [Morchella sextelata]|uniref:uncharacterized protein n=1 Tax=Morchella sextelata TaxID=1174677 RepID=UPI001D05853E|nr:uncharacterized protein H6S33_004462 [Morchella sextelata]KAH0606005.1 hypothetical protein H6S33_004462 [Morchella sextelata]